MIRASLQPHPHTPCPMVDSIEVRLDLIDADMLRLRYGLAGNVQRVRWPDSKMPVRSEGLWRRTCLEAFVRAPGGPGYFELNFAPSGDWAAYAFSDYRAGMHPLDPMRAPQISQNTTPSRYEVEVCLSIPTAIEGTRWNIAAVIEDLAGNLYYWALMHPPGKPDFHDERGFALTIPSLPHPATPRSNA